MRIVIAILLIASTAHAGGAAVKAKLVCERAALGMDDGSAPSENVLACDVTLAVLPAGNVVATFTRTPPAAPGDAPISMSVADDSGTYRASAALSPTPSPDCKPLRIDATITVEGRAAWSGHTTFATACLRTRAHLACTTTDGKPLAPRARLDRDVACTVIVDSGDDSGRFFVIATVAGSPGGVPVVRDAGRGEFSAAGDLLPCAVTTFRGEIDRDEHPVWSQTITIRPSCPRAHPRPAR